MGTEKDVSVNFNSALVTGGGGFVGGAVVRRLLELGVEVRVLGRNPYPELSKLGVQCVVGNLCDEDVMMQATRGVDVVFHVAALAGVWGPWKDYYRTNVVGTENVLNGCIANKVSSLVYTSTPSVVFDRKDIEGGDESLGYATKYLCNYAKTKVIAEKMVLAEKAINCCALRPHLIWGPGDPHLLPRLLQAGREKQLQIVGDASNLVDISYIDNVAHAHILAAKNLSGTASCRGQAYFISQCEPVNLWGWVNELFQRMDIQQVTKKVSFATGYRAGAVMEFLHTVLRLRGEPRMSRFLAEQLAKSHYFSCGKAERDLGYSPIVSTETGLEKSIQWLKENGK